MRKWWCIINFIKRNQHSRFKKLPISLIPHVSNDINLNRKKFGMPEWVASSKFQKKMDQRRLMEFLVLVWGSGFQIFFFSNHSKPLAQSYHWRDTQNSIKRPSYLYQWPRFHSLDHWSQRIFLYPKNWY